MGVYINGMEMPQNCEECDVKAVCKNYWKLIREQHTRPSWCPLVPISPHERLIEKHDVFKLITAFPEVDKLLPVEFMEALYNLPTIIPTSEEGE